MSENTKTAKTYDWRAEMAKAGAEKDKSAKYNKSAGERLWKACKAGINEWLPNAKGDDSGEKIYGEFLSAYGESRKGDCSKMTTVAKAVRDKGLDLADYPNLSKAYAAAVKVTKTAKVEAEEDDAAEEVISQIAKEAPATASAPEEAAKIVLAKGVDEAARLLLDALGAENTPAHRALSRALTMEINGRVKPAPKKAKKADAEKEGAVKATATKAAPKAQPASAKKPTPVSASKGDPNKKALPPKAAPAKAAPAKAAPAKKAAPVKAAPAKAAPAKAAPVKKAAPAKAAPAKAAPAKAAPVKTA